MSQRVLQTLLRLQIEIILHQQNRCLDTPFWIRCQRLFQNFTSLRGKTDGLKRDAQRPHHLTPPLVRHAARRRELKILDCLQIAFLLLPSREFSSVVKRSQPADIVLAGGEIRIDILQFIEFFDNPHGLTNLPVGFALVDQFKGSRELIRRRFLVARKHEGGAATSHRSQQGHDDDELLL